MGMTALTGDTQDLSDANILQPAQQPGDARPDAGAFGPNLTVSAGDMVAVKTADGLLYRAATGAADGTQNAVGLSMRSFQTDANGKVFFGTTPGTTAGRLNSPWTTAPIFKTGIFQLAQIKKGGVAAIQADVLTLFGNRAAVLQNGFIRIV